MKTRLNWLMWIGGGVLVVTAFNVHAAVTLAGKEWQQPAHFTNLSWNDISATCSSTTGACAGTLNSISLVGWTWASVKEVGALFEAAGIPGFSSPYSPASYAAINATWASAFIDTDAGGPDTGLFDSTGIEDAVSYVWGLTRSSFSTQQGSTVAYSPFVQFDPAGVGFATSESSSLLALSDDDLGGWFYRPASIPEPGTVTLLALGLSGLGVFRLRRCAKSERRYSVGLV